MKFCGNSPQKGGSVHQKGGRSKQKRGSRQMYDTEGPYRVFLWYRLGKYQENTNQYHTEIPNRDTTLDITCLEQACELAANEFLFFLKSLKYTPSLACPGVKRSTLQHRCLHLRPHIRRPLSFLSTPPPISVALLCCRCAAAANITTPPPPPSASSIVLILCDHGCK